MPNTISRRTAILVLTTLAAAGSACASSDSTAPTTTAPAPTAGRTIAATLDEWNVRLDATSAPTGTITFSASNTGTRTHELALFKTDLQAGQLPIDEHGAVDERGEGVELVEEIEDVGVGETRSFTATVQPGKYFLVCNLVEPDTGDKHFAHNMYTAFTVT